MTEYNEKFPEGFIEYYLKFANTAIVYGIPVRDMTHDETIACMLSAFHDLAVVRAEHQKELDVLAGKPLQ